MSLRHPVPSHVMRFKFSLMSHRYDSYSFIYDSYSHSFLTDMIHIHSYMIHILTHVSPIWFIFIHIWFIFSLMSDQYDSYSFILVRQIWIISHEKIDETWVRIWIIYEWIRIILVRHEWEYESYMIPIWIILVRHEWEGILKESYVRALTPVSLIWYDSLRTLTHVSLLWYDSIICVWYDSLRVPSSSILVRHEWVMSQCDVTHWYVLHDSFIRVWYGS